MSFDLIAYSIDNGILCSGNVFARDWRTCRWFFLEETHSCMRAFWGWVQCCAALPSSNYSSLKSCSIGAQGGVDLLNRTYLPRSFSLLFHRQVSKYTMETVKVSFWLFLHYFLKMGAKYVHTLMVTLCAIISVLTYVWWRYARQQCNTSAFKWGIKCPINKSCPCNRW